tara:strand:- start:281341 stop:281844 length:504 start_codon:yes stop_codon:yes gene_type:complete
VASQPEDKRANEIRQAMHEIRCELDDDVSQIKQSASTLTDWQYYIRHYPWACVGAAAAFGFMIVPRKLKVSNPYTDELLKLARKKRLVINKEDDDDADRAGVVKTAFTFLSGLAMRAAVAQLAQHAASILNQNQNQGSGSQSSASAQADTTDSAATKPFENHLDRRF